MFSEITGGVTAFPERDKPSVVKFNYAGGNSARSSAEWQFSKSFLRIVVCGYDQAQVIRRDIQEQGGRHQIGIAHVVVFVAIERVEPRSIHDWILMVVFVNASSDIFAL